MIGPQGAYLVAPGPTTSVGFGAWVPGLATLRDVALIVFHQPHAPSHRHRTGGGGACAQYNDELTT